MINIKLKINYFTGDWGLGIGDWGLGVVANNPNPKTPNPKTKLFF